MCDYLRFNSILSLLGSFLTVFTYWYWPQERTATQLLVVYLSIADFGVSVAIIVQNAVILAAPSIAPSSYCPTLAAIEYFFYVQALLWTCCIAHHIFDIIQTTDTLREKVYAIMRRGYMAVCWFVPTILTIIIASTGQFGDQQPYDVGPWKHT